MFRVEVLCKGDGEKHLCCFQMVVRLRLRNICR